MANQKVEWWWKSNSNPFSSTESPEWTRYSDVENEIIEDAYQKKEPHAMLDDVHIDFAHQIQISNSNFNNQRPIQRRTLAKTDQRLREARFMPDPIAPISSFHNLVGYRKIFIDSAMELLNIKLLNRWDERKEEILQQAMEGLLYEGKLVGKQCEAKWIVERLNQVKSKTKTEIGECCVRLYTMESFLYKVLNQTMRLIGDPTHEQSWRSKVKTL